MKIKLLGKNCDDIRELLNQHGFEDNSDTPELIVTYGGDGSLLGAEREWPGIPKLPLRDSRTARLCEKHCHETQLQNFLAGKISLDKLKKIEVAANGHRLTAVNDIFIHNAEQASALRYQVWIDDELYADEIAGDAVGLSSVHGSSAYYRSITHSVFRVGLGLAFSNSMELVNHMVIAETSSVKIRIIRGPAQIVADNSPERIVMGIGDEAILKQADEVALIYGLENFMCPQCRFWRHLNQYRFSKLVMPKVLS
ncbi:MAG: hypothetical protein PHV75_08345 [Victivallaceae bacterium]|nr:hypothetical protein [Victivallaceae bacterium]NLK83427.1 hypothetical protein [Lentisphaerota bacterium]MDD3116404.1 hypothetical protein [Victivallaceae bacterium]MDD3703801.1 hypothetical protein [Victivallaceae bacterium]MDD4318512.1 hypothetical protein [Victivallaceae bacterium]